MTIVKFTKEELYVLDTVLFNVIDDLEQAAEGEDYFDTGGILIQLSPAEYEALKSVKQKI